MRIQTILALAFLLTNPLHAEEPTAEERLPLEVANLPVQEDSTESLPQTFHEFRPYGTPAVWWNANNWESRPVTESTESSGSPIRIEAETLAEIREQLGIDLLKGTLLEGDNKEAFNETAAGMILAENEQSPAPVRDVPPYPTTGQQPFFGPAAYPCAARPCAAPTPQRTHHLRQVARGLDEEANHLEEMEQYKEADQIRTIAQELRLQARR